MNADSIFNMGATHSICQDYAIARHPSAANPFVILSDGCSTSPETDIGARLLVRATEQLLRTSVAEEPGTLHRRAAQLALSWADLLELPVQSIDATLLTAYILNDEILASCSGDGLIVIESIDGKLDAFSISYPSGYPLYPAYSQQPERLKLINLNQRSHKEVLHFHSPSKDASLRLASTRLSHETIEVFRFKVSDCKVVSICSDGLQSFLSTNDSSGTRRVEPVSIAEVIKELVSFKSLNGAFVARRVKKFMKECGQKGWQHGDDLSLAAIHLGGALCSAHTPFPA